MSLLIKALEQAAKDRTSQRGEAQPRAAQRAVPGLISVPSLELAPRTVASFDEPAVGEAAPGTPHAGSPTGLSLETPLRPRRRVESDAQSSSAVERDQGVHADASVSARRGLATLGAALRSNPIALFAAVGVLCGLAFGVYVYLQMTQPGAIRGKGTAPVPVVSPEPPAMASPEPAPVTPPAVQPPSSNAAVAPRADSPAAPATRHSDAPSASESRQPRKLIPASAVIAADEPDAAEPLPAAEQRVERAVSRKSAAASRAAPAPHPSAKPEPRDAIAVSPAASQARVNPHVSEGYALLQAGDLAAARALYTRAVEAEPLDIDALLGLAYIASQENRSDEALRTYLRILQLNPRHAIAQAALIGFMGRADPAAAETRLKQLLSREPSPFLHFVLGNLYSDQSLWTQAQHAYFQAHHLEPDNPDYAYNLAVGLDHLRQSRLALEFYRRAEQLATLRGRSSFDIAQARARISTLSSELR